MLKQRHRIPSLAILSLLLILSACSDDGSSDNSGNDPANNQPNNDPNADPEPTPNPDMVVPDDCEENADCADGELCVEGQCVSDGGPECVQDSDCEPDQICQRDRCVTPEPLCPPNSTTCDNNAVVTCDEDTGQEDRQNCGPDAACIDDNQGVRCEPLLCEPNTSVCRDEATAIACTGDGLSEQIIDCSDTERCQDGECVFFEPIDCEDALGDISTPELAEPFAPRFEGLAVCPDESDHFTGNPGNAAGVLYTTLETRESPLSPLRAEVISGERTLVDSWEVTGRRQRFVPVPAGQRALLRVSADTPHSYDLDTFLCPEDDLNNDSIDNAAPLLDHISEPLSHCGGFDATWFRVDLQQNQFFNLELRPEAPHQRLDSVRMQLEDPQGDVAAASTRILNSDNIKIEVPRVPATGTYLLSIQSLSGEHAGRYQFRTRSVPAPDQPDLALENPTIEADRINLDQPFDVSFDVLNAGLQPTGTYPATLILSPDAFIGNTDEVLGTIDGQNLTPGQRQSFRFDDIRISNRDPEFDLFLCLQLDGPDAIAEQNEENNALCIKFELGEPLDVIDIDCSDAFEPNDTRSRPRVLAPGTYTDLTICNEEDETDFYQICPAPGTEVSVNLFFDDDEGDIDLRVRKLNGDTIASRNIFNDLSPVTFTVPHDCVWLEVFIDGSGGTTYDMELDFDAQ